MKKIHHYHRRFRLSILQASAITLIICAFLLPSYIKFEKSGNNCFTVRLDNTIVGTASSEELVDHCLIQARKNIASQSEDLTFLDVQVTVTGREILWGETDSSETLIANMEKVMRSKILETLHRSYTVKIKDTTINLGSYEDVSRFLNEAISPYDVENLYQVDLVLDDSREVNVLTTQMVLREEQNATDSEYATSAGANAAINEMIENLEPVGEKDFEDYFQGLTGIEFGESIEVVEAYMLESELDSVEYALNYFLEEQETQIIYKVVSGDTLSKISIINNIPMTDLIAINPALEDENSTIRVGQELIITVPEPELAVIWKDERVITEDYEAPVEYIYNDNWYTTQQVTRQEPSAGRRKIVAITTYENNTEIDREIIKEVVYADAVPKIVEKGTKIPPTYIKPIAGGRLSSKFGNRKAPIAGASTYHSGVDWAVATGTSVKASNGGTVVTAGWVSGYGYAVYINHSDGRQTRYGHLSKVLVKVGQTVSQGQQIALSGNTGRSTGPHLHFEMRIGGKAVDPLKYLN